MAGTGNGPEPLAGCDDGPLDAPLDGCAPEFEESGDFYADCVAMYVTGTVDALAVNLAWVFVALRVGHSLVHLNFIHVITRVTLFATSNFAVIALWVVFGTRIWERAGG